mmetsp:Transcript_19579/g.24208  ORF Transcript_19579/g.24208 Transcript_19579/m.24208 type:complete len:84 (+) Transcript_19579:240-491(+)
MNGDDTVRITGSDDKFVKVWDLVGGKEMFSLEGHTSWVYGCAMNADGTRGMSVSDDRTVKVWEFPVFTTATTLVSCSTPAICN